MGLRGLERDMEAMRQTGTPQNLGSAQVLEGKVEQLRDAVREFRRTGPAAVRQGRDGEVSGRTVKSTRCRTLSGAIWTGCGCWCGRWRLEARRAVTRRRGRRLRGQLDTRRTLRRNMGWGGIPFNHRVETEAHRETAGDGVVRRLRSVAAMSGFADVFCTR